MKIAVNTRFLLPHKLEGIGWFTFEIFKRLTRQHPEIEWLFLFDRKFSDEFIFAENVRGRVVSPQARHPALWYWWFEQSLPAVLRREKPDLFISPDGFLPLKSNIKSLGVIHDINFEHHPGYIPKLVGKYYRHYFPKFAHKADRLATVSEYSRADISETYGVSTEKIDLVYNGCGHFFAPLSPERREAMQQEITEGSPYFIFIGALNPRKNMAGMLRAYTEYRRQGGNNKFLVVGEKMFWDREVENIYESHPYRSDLVFTGRLEGKDLSRVLAAAEALLFVSHFEGFGIPIVEAFTCQTPVITSTTTSMPEVAGDAALLCDPNSYQQIAEAMHEVSDPSVRNSLIAKGKERAKLFTWERSAEMMWQSIQKTLGR